MVNLFKKPNPPDIAEGHENVTITVRFSQLFLLLTITNFFSINHMFFY